MWKKCKEREMKILSSPTPKNFLDEMAVKTEQGILWKFPINNEQGIDEEKVRYLVLVNYTNGGIWAGIIGKK